MCVCAQCVGTAHTDTYTRWRTDNGSKTTAAAAATAADEEEEAVAS